MKQYHTTVETSTPSRLAALALGRSNFQRVEALMSNALGNNGGRLYSFANQPVLIDCNFVVDSTNGNGLGVRSLKGQGVRNVFMHTSAAMTGTVTSASFNITSIAGGTSSLQVGMPVQGTDIPVGTKIVAILSSSSVQMSAAATGSPGSASITYQGVGPNGVANPNPAVGYALVQLKSNYQRYLGGFSGFACPTTGGTIHIDASDAALTIGNAYIIASVGAGPAGTATIAPVADSSGSLASKYFMLYDSYGNSFCIWFSVSGVGSPPNLGPAAGPGQRGLQYVQQSISTNDTAATIGADLVLTIENLQSGVNGVYSFTASGTSTVTVVSTALQPLAGVPQDGSSVIPAQGPAVPITFTISSGSATAGSIWTDGAGHLYTVTATVSSGTTLYTSGVGVPGINGVGTLTFVSGSGASTALTFSAAVAGLATGFTFALTVSDTNLQDWQGVGLPAGLTPTVGQSFIATATGAGGSTGLVIASGVSGITSFEVVGDPNQSFAPGPQGGTPHPGAWILVKMLADTSASVTTKIPTAPVNGSVAGMSFYVDAKFSPSNIGL